MIQFNLLPDIKLQYIKTQRTKQLVIGIAIIIGGAAIGLFILLYFAVAVFQKQHIDDLSSDIKKDTAKLQATSDLNKILTVQNQLGALTCTEQELKDSTKPCLHDKKPVASRLFTFLPQLTPNTLNIASLGIDFAQNTMSITGNADALSTVNKFVDTLKFTNFTSKDNTTGQAAFSNVVLAAFAVTAGTNARGVTYQITTTFNPAIFDASKDDVALVVPKKTTTRSELEKPTEIFNKPAQTTNQTAP